jgi:hypothetical protein
VRGCEPAVGSSNESEKQRMKMVIVALVGGVVLGFVDAQFLAEKIQSAVAASPTTENLLTTGVAAFLGVIWGWIAKGMIGGKPKD